MASNTNLLEETVSTLALLNKSPEDVLWVGSASGKYAISWEEFAKISNVYYNPGFGGQEIVADLVVVGDGWWLSRSEYDGSEGWQFNTPPIQKDTPLSFSKVMSDEGECWITIHQAHRVGGKYNKYEDEDES